MTTPITLLPTVSDYCTIYTRGPGGWIGRKASACKVVRAVQGHHEISFKLFRGEKAHRVTVYTHDVVVIQGHWPEHPLSRSAHDANFDLWIAGKSVLLDARRR